MRVQGITQRPDIVAIADAADHINDIKAHRRRADIPAPGLILPADRHARARIGLATMSAAFLQRTGTPVIIVFSIRIRREAANIHIHHISTKERPSVRPGRIHLKHRGMRLQIGVAASPARPPIIVRQRDIEILLTVQLRRIATHAAF